MLSKFSVRSIVLFVFFMLAVGSSVMADDSRINRAPYHFGGDTLFCSLEEGCKLLNDTGLKLGQWSQDDIVSAFAATASSGENSQVAVMIRGLMV